MSVSGGRFCSQAIVCVGDPRPNGKASKFRYLLSQGENGAEEDDAGFEISAPPCPSRVRGVVRKSQVRGVHCRHSQEMPRGPDL